MDRRYVTARQATHCAHCTGPITPGELIAPARAGWLCRTCDTAADDIDHVLHWLHHSIDKHRTPGLLSQSTQTLIVALTERGIPARRRGDRSAWHRPGSPTAWLEQPFLIDAHGLLHDAQHYGFAPRLPYPGTRAILDALDPHSSEPAPLAAP
jgi:hypothetical protein